METRMANAILTRFQMKRMCKLRKKIQFSLDTEEQKKNECIFDNALRLWESNLQGVGFVHMKEEILGKNRVGCSMGIISCY